MVDIENQIINFAKYFYQKTKNTLQNYLHTSVLESNLYQKTNGTNY